MRIKIITAYPFPYGMAQTNRVIAMAKGLIFAGAEVDLVISKATELGKPRNTAGKGFYEGIKFTYATGTPIRPNGKASRALLSGFTPNFSVYSASASTQLIGSK